MLPEDAVVDDLKPFYEAERERYPTLEPVIEGEVSVNIDATGSPVAAATRQQIGFIAARLRSLFQSAGQRAFLPQAVAVLRMGKLPRRDQALVDRYLAVAKPLRVSRLGLRYFNRLDLPLGAEIKDYLLTAPILRLACIKNWRDT